MVAFKNIQRKKILEMLFIGFAYFSSGGLLLTIVFMLGILLSR